MRQNNVFFYTNWGRKNDLSTYNTLLFLSWLNPHICWSCLILERLFPSIRQHKEELLSDKAWGHRYKDPLYSLISVTSLHLHMHAYTVCARQTSRQVTVWWWAETRPPVASVGTRKSDLIVSGDREGVKSQKTARGWGGGGGEGVLLCDWGHSQRFWRFVI